MRFLGFPAVLAVLVAFALAGCGDDGGDDTTGTDTTPTTALSTTSTDSTAGGENGGDQDGNGGQGSQGDSGSQDSDSGNQDGGDSDDAEPPAVDGDFGSELRSIVGTSLGQLSELTGGSAMGDPGTYADLLETATGQIDETISQLEGLDPPDADSEKGVQSLIDAYSDLGDAVSQGADDFGSGDQARVKKALGYLGEAAVAFRSALGEASQELGGPGFAGMGG